MKKVYVIILVATATLLSLTTADDNLEVGEPEGKLISTFQIVRFPNDACTGSTATRNGTCYTSAECSDKGGTSSGSCADGFGVCCTFVITACGQTSSENITYWDAPAAIPNGECNLKISPVNDNICKLRLDFLTFVITGPSTSITSEAMLFASGIPGGAADAGGGPAGTALGNIANWATNCLTDIFSVSSPNPANKPPVICGINSGLHMYVDMDSDTTNVLSFIFQRLAGPASAFQDTRGVPALATRDWDITLTQFECGYVNIAPPGCTMYLWSDSGTQTAGWITSYNFQAAGTKHLANQNQKVCIRRERNICWAGFYTVAAGAFNFGGMADAAALTTNVFASSGQPCGYIGEAGNGIGAEGVMAGGYDCVIIPGLFGVGSAVAGLIDADASHVIARLGTAIATAHVPAPPQMSSGGIFGGDANFDGAVVITGGVPSVAMTLFTQHVPFQVTFKSDGFEGTGVEAEFTILTNSIGMKLSYDLIACTA